MRLTTIHLLFCSVAWCGGVGLGQTPLLAPTVGKATPPLPPKSASPVDFFRELLDTKGEVREKLLAGKSPEHRRVLENSLRLYQGLGPQERELRLRTMELRFHLTSLLHAPSSNRTDRLKLVPERDRPLVEERLKLWDQFSPEDQKELLENERMIRILEIVSAGLPRKEIPLSAPTSNQVRQIEQQLIQWQTLPEARRG